jgi:hypothetical protein
MGIRWNVAAPKGGIFLNPRIRAKRWLCSLGGLKA